MLISKLGALGLVDVKDEGEVMVLTDRCATHLTPAVGRVVDASRDNFQREDDPPPLRQLAVGNRLVRSSAHTSHQDFRGRCDSS